MKVRVIQNVRGKLNRCCLRFGWTSYVTLELSRFESGFFWVNGLSKFDYRCNLRHELN